MRHIKRVARPLNSTATTLTPILSVEKLIFFVNPMKKVR